MAVEKTYTWNAKDYASNSQNQFQWAKELIPKLHLKGAQSLLDIGCGDGKITADLARALPDGKVLGIDNSAQMINLALASYPKSENPNLDFCVMDARSIVLGSQFDVAFSNAALHWVLDQNAVLHGVNGALKSGGRLLFQMAGKGNAKAVLDIIGELSPLPKWRSYLEGFAFPYAFLSVEEYTSLLKGAGLNPVRVELIPRDMKFPNAAGMAGWVRTTWLPYLDKIPEQLRQCFIDEIVGRYQKMRMPDLDGTIHLDMVRLEVEATKP